MQVYTDTLAELLEHHVAHEMAGLLVRQKTDLKQGQTVIAELLNADYDDELVALLWKRAHEAARTERTWSARL